jgi:hypothetical protein
VTKKEIDKKWPIVNVGDDFQRLKPIHRTCFIFYPLAYTALPTHADPHVQRLIGTTTSQHQDARICTIMSDHSSFVLSVLSHMCFVDLRSQEYTQESTRQPEDH